MTQVKPSWDLPTSPYYYKDVLILGIPGSGYETVVGKAFQDDLEIRNLGDFGFRSSSLYPYQWLVNLDQCYNTITSPWEKPRIYIGYAQNWHAVMRLPWARVFRYHLEEEELKKRIIEYRNKSGLTSLNHDNPSKIIEHLLILDAMLKESRIPIIDAKLLDDPKSLLNLLTGFTAVPIIKDETIMRLRKLQNNDE